MTLKLRLTPRPAIIARVTPRLSGATLVAGDNIEIDQVGSVYTISASVATDVLAYSGMQINGSMEVSQEKGTTLWTPANTAYVLDGVRLYQSGTMVVQSQQVTDAPAGYNNSLKLTVQTAQAVIGSGDYVFALLPIEGYRTVRLAFGTASAQPLTICFWVKAHRAGIYSGCVQNSASNRSYPFSFTINDVDTWEFKTITLLGDTSVAWLTTTGVGLYLIITMALGSTLTGPVDAWAGVNYAGVNGTTNGVAATTDTFQITGLIVLPGIATPTEAKSPLMMRPYDQELLTCQRYYEKNPDFVTTTRFTGSVVISEQYYDTIRFRQIKRATPTMTLTHSAAVGFAAVAGGAGASVDGFYEARLATSTTTSGAFASDWVADARL